MADIIYFTSTIDPATGDIALVKVVEPADIAVRPLIVYDPTNADPTLARFYEVNDGEQDDE